VDLDGAVAAGVAGVLLPDAERLVAGANESPRPPRRKYRAFDLLPGRAEGHSADGAYLRQFVGIG
jgi:hypothetical protein